MLIEMVNSEDCLTKVKDKYGLFQIMSELLFVKMSKETYKGTERKQFLKTIEVRSVMIAGWKSRKVTSVESLNNLMRKVIALKLSRGISRKFVTMPTKTVLKILVTTSQTSKLLHKNLATSLPIDKPYGKVRAKIGLRIFSGSLKCFNHKTYPINKMSDHKEQRKLTSS